MGLENSSHSKSPPGRASGSSTGAPGFPTTAEDQRAQYDPERTGYNPATGSGYTKPGSLSRDASGQDERIQHAPSTVQRGQPEDQGPKSKSTQMGENVGQKAKGVVAGVHGAGESLRGGLNAAVDRAFGEREGVERNEEIARRGEQEYRSGEFAANNAPRYKK